MGRASRLKKERKLKELTLLLGENSKNILTSSSNCSVFRFFPKESEADALVKGKIWISTLKTCREYEDPERGDPEEAKETYNSGLVVGGSDDQDFADIAKRVGIKISENASNVTIDNCIRSSSISDAYVLCATTDFSPDKHSDIFGMHCVEITNPLDFFVHATNSLKNCIPIIEAAAGKIIYKDRHYTGLESRPGPLGFVKPKDKYHTQKEFRFLWIPESSQRINPFLLDCLKIKNLCRRIT